MNDDAPALHDELLIRRLIERWAVWRDAGDWERFATVWHPDGVMMATWFQGPFADFIRVTQEGWTRGIGILHFLGGSAIEVAGDRAIAQTPGAVPKLDARAPAALPEGYRHLAYIQQRIGYRVRLDMPMLRGDAVQALVARGARWLAGGALER